MFDKIKSIHFIGVGGYGMSALAYIALKKGLQVSGSDLSRNKLVEKLIEEGLLFFNSHDEANVCNLKIDLTVFSSAIKIDNPELSFLKKKQVPHLSRGEMLGLICAGKKTIAIGGTHGKTTTTSMISHIFQKSGLSPTVLVGGEMISENTNALCGNSDWLITEADESDASLLFLKPEVAVITNIEEDHMDFYKNKNEILRIFQKFSCSAGKTVFTLEDPASREFFSAEDPRFHFCSLKNKNARWYADNIQFHNMESAFDLYHQSSFSGRVHLGVTGIHNVQNCLSAIAASSFSGLEISAMINAVSSFGGVARRIQLLSEKNGINIYDDYAHHPTEVRTVLSALKSNWPERRLVALFQPHRYSRFDYFKDQFAESLSSADEILLLDIYAASEKNPGSLSTAMLIPRLSAIQKKALYLPGSPPDISALRNFIREGDIVVGLGAGSVSGYVKELAQIFSKENP